MSVANKKAQAARSLKWWFCMCLNRVMLFYIHQVNLSNQINCRMEYRLFGAGISQSCNVLAVSCGMQRTCFVVPVWGCRGHSCLVTSQTLATIVLWYRDLFTKDYLV